MANRYTPMIGGKLGDRIAEDVARQRSGEQLVQQAAGADREDRHQNGRRRDPALFGPTCSASLFDWLARAHAPTAAAMMIEMPIITDPSKDAHRDVIVLSEFLAQRKRRDALHEQERQGEDRDPDQ